MAACLLRGLRMQRRCHDSACSSVPEGAYPLNTSHFYIPRPTADVWPAASSGGSQPLTPSRCCSRC